MLLVTLLVTGSFNAWADTVVKFQENFSSFTNGTGGTGTGTTSWNSSTSNEASLTGWTFVKCYEGKLCLRLGAKSSKGEATTPALNITGDATLTFKIGAWNTTGEKKEMKVFLVDGETETELATETMNIGTWQDKTVALTGLKATDKIKFAASIATTNRFFLDDVTITQEESGTVTPTEKKDGMFDFDDISTTLAYGASYELVEDQDYLTDGVITLVSSNENVLSVKGKSFTAVGVGSATISATAAEGNTYKAITDPETITITVTAPTGKTTAPTESVAFYESFNNFVDDAGTHFKGGRDGKWTDAGSTELTADDKSKMDTEGNEWTFTKVYGGNKCIKLGSGSAKGVATTPALGVTGNATLTFEAGAWDKSSESKNIELFLNDETTPFQTEPLNAGQFDTYTVALENLVATDKIKFAAKNTSNNRFFLDEVKVTVAGVSTASATIAASGYGSFCCEYPLDFTTTSGYKAYYVSAVNGDAVTFTQITGKVKGGVPVILYGNPGTYNIPTTDSDIEPEDYYLRGTLAPTYVEGTESDGSKNYGLSNGEFCLINDGMVKAGKAYLNVPAGTNASSRLRIVMPEATGISTLAADNAKAETFNLQGQRVERPAKGIYIVNGKKFINK